MVHAANGIECLVAYPSNHDSAHPHRRREPLQQQGGHRLKEHVRVVEDTQGPCPLRAGETAELLLDASALLEVDDGRIADVADVDSHDEVHKGVP